MRTLGIRHLALNVSDPQRSKAFYQEVIGMTVEWEPDPDNVYLTSGGLDNLALHRAPAGAAAAGQVLDHFGIVVPAPKDVDEWHARVVSKGIAIAKELKTHRDGARSFYFRDPDGIIIELATEGPGFAVDEPVEELGSRMILPDASEIRG